MGFTCMKTNYVEHLFRKLLVIQIRSFSRVKLNFLAQHFFYD